MQAGKCCAGGPGKPAIARWEVLGTWLGRGAAKGHWYREHMSPLTRAPVSHTCTSQRMTLLSQPPDASCFESGLKLTVSTLRW